MKHRIRYKGYTIQQREDDILDKISKYGIKSLRKDEIDFLNANKDGNQEEIHKKMISNEMDNIFEDDNGYFRFEHIDTEFCNDKINIIGIFYVPDLILSGGKKIEGRLEGRLVVYKNNQTSPDFFSIPKHAEHTHDIFEFCNGLEYELDNFIDYIVGEIYEKNKEL